MALADHWPLLGLRVRTPRLELRYPDDDLAVAVLEVASTGIHPPDEMPFSVPWSRTPPDELPRRSLQQWYWRNRAELRPESWALDLVVLAGGEVVGVQGLTARDFPVRRGVLSGSWLGLAHQGRGIGSEMRRAILHLAFAGFAASFAETEAWADNGASLAVTRKLGYEPSGDGIEVREGAAVRQLRFRMERSWWEQHLAADDVELEGVERCLPLLGAEPV